MVQKVPAAMADTDIVKTSGTQTVAGVKTFSSPPVFASAPTVTAAQSMVRLNTANGYGSTNTLIRRFTNVVTNQGSDITYADSASLGASFTINTAGVYWIGYDDSHSTAADFGLSINTTQPTTSFISLAASEQLAGATSSAASYAAQATWCGYLAAGTVIRAHVGAANTTGSRIAHFTITRVA